jgi:hypothetical protein
MSIPSAPRERAPTRLRDGDTAGRDKRDLDLLCDTRGQDHIRGVAFTRMLEHLKPSTVTASQPIRFAVSEWPTDSCHRAPGRSIANDPKQSCT